MSTLGGLSSPYPGYEVLAAARNAEEDDSEAEDVDEKTTAPAEDELSPSMSNTEKYLGHSALCDYLASTRSEDVSYFAFLNANRDVISANPPFSKTWYANQNTWGQRFLQEITHLGDYVVEKAKIEFKDTKYLENFWSSIILHRNQLLTKDIFDNGSLDLVGTAGKSQIKNIRDLYTRSSSSSKGQIESTVKETKQYRFNKRSLDDYHQTNMSIPTKKLRDEEIDETEVLDSDDGSMSPCEAVVKAKKERELRQEIMTSGLPAKPARTNLDAFAKVFRDMLDNQKWRLSTGKVIEDALFEFGMRCSEEHLCHSFILDPDDAVYINDGIFTKMELEEIRLHNRRELPNLPDDLLKHMMTFAKGTIQELRKQLQQPIDAIGDNFIREIHYDLDWLQYAMYTLVREYESGALKVNHHEQWYNIHLWGPIVDQCFANILDMEGVRGESCSVASGIRKNINRETPSKEALKKWKCGRKADLILRTTADLEFGGGEAGRMYKSEKGTKWLLESGMKLPKMLKDMLAQLAAEVNWSKRTLRELLVVGFVHCGRRQMLLELDCPEGFTCRLRRGKVYNVAESVETHAAKTLPLLAATWRAKAAVRNCVHLVLTHTTDGDAEDEVLRLIKEAGSTDSFESRGDVLEIPPCFQTPSKQENK